MITISKTFDFDAAHHLWFLPDGHKCKRMHGHTYRCELVYSGPLDEHHMLIDYADIAEAWGRRVHARLDHQVLNDVDGLECPTTERLVAWIFDVMETVGAARLERCRVYESSTTYAERTR